jgi:cytolysin-activating lysine-acyltransferase
LGIEKRSQPQGQAGGRTLSRGTGGEAAMKEAGAARRAEQPLLGEAALQEALAGFGASSGSQRPLHATNGSSSGKSEHAAGQGQIAPAPKTVSQVLGEITWLMTQSPRHKSIPLGDLEWLLMPAILLKQFRIFYKGEQAVGVAVWALVDDVVAKRIDAGEKRLTAVEWKSGTNMRILDVVAPFGAEVEMREQIAAVRPSAG